jgi:hypothetical protein
MTTIPKQSPEHQPAAGDDLGAAVTAFGKKRTAKAIAIANLRSGLFMDFISAETESASEN